jgi:outer membrane protein
MSKGFFAFVLGTAFVALAPAPSEGSKIGYVDLQRVLAETPDGKAAKSRIDSLRKSRQAELDKSTQEFQVERSNLARQRLMLKPEIVEQRERELAEKMSKLQSTYLRLQQDLSAEEVKALKHVTGKAQSVVERIAADEGLTLVLEKNEAGVLWAASSLDLTTEVIRRYNK